MCRNLALAATALSLVLAAPAAARDKASKPEGSKTDAAAPGGPALPAPAAPPAPRKATPEQRREAERLDPLARAAFWARELEVDGRDVEAGLRLASALRAIGRYDEAAFTARNVLVISPDNPDAMMELARANLAAGQGFYAIEPLTRLKARDPRDWRIPSLLGVAYAQVSRDADALAAWNEALALSPENPAVLSNMAMHKAARGQAAEAEALLRRAVAQPGATIQMRQNLALVLGLQGKLSEAEQLARHDLPPEIANNNIAYLQAASGAAGASRSWQALQQAQAAAN